MEQNNFSFHEYNKRREELDTGGAIGGIFYIYNNNVIPDYRSEYLANKSHENILINHKNALRNHEIFYTQYMLRNYPDLPNDFNFLPKGMVEPFPTVNITDIFLDNCHFNEDIIEQIIEIYRIKGKYKTISNRYYTCHKCVNIYESQWSN